MKTSNREINDDIFTEEDRKMHEQAMRELEAGESISLEQAKKNITEGRVKTVKPEELFRELDI